MTLKTTWNFQCADAPADRGCIQSVTSSERGRFQCLNFTDTVTCALSQTLSTRVPTTGHTTTRADLFTGEGAMILVVPSFSPFSEFAVIRLMLFDPSNKRRGKMDDRRL